MTSTAKEYRDKRRQALVQALMLPVMVMVTKMMMDSILGNMAGDPAVAPMMTTLTTLLNVMIIVGTIGCILVATRYHMLAMQAPQSRGRTSRSTTTTDADDVEAPSLGDILGAINSMLPDLTFGTYRRVDAVDVPSGVDCTDCGSEATVAREYRDSTVRFGLAFGKTDPEQVTYCDECADAEDAICEGWVTE